MDIVDYGAKVVIVRRGLVPALPPLALRPIVLCSTSAFTGSAGSAFTFPLPAPFPLRSPLLAQCFVYGDSLKAQLVAIVVPDAEVLVPWAKERGMSGSLTQLIADPAVQAAIMKSMQEEGREAKLRGFEQVGGRGRWQRGGGRGRLREEERKEARLGVLKALTRKLQVGDRERVLEPVEVEGYEQVSEPANAVPRAGSNYTLHPTHTWQSL